MYAVFSEGSLSYLGDSQTEALQVFNQNPGAALHTVNSVEEVKRLLDDNKPLRDEVTAFAKQVKDDTTEAMREIMDRLREAGINEELVTKIKTNSEKLVGEVRSLGVRGIKAVGEGFVNLGELLRRTGEEAPKEE